MTRDDEWVDEHNFEEHGLGKGTHQIAKGDYAVVLHAEEDTSFFFEVLVQAALL